MSKKSKVDYDHGFKTIVWGAMAYYLISDVIIPLSKAIILFIEKLPMP